VLLGLQFEGVYEGLRASGDAGPLLADIALVSLVVIGVRIAWQSVPPLLGRAVPAAARADTGADWRERLAVGWSGMRGAISLAAALALPQTLDSGAPFAERELLIFVTVGVIAVTLVGQGLTLPLLLRKLRLYGDREWSPDEAIARLEAAQAALDRLDELEREERISEERLRRMRELYRARFRRCMAVIGGESEEARVASREPRALWRAAPRAHRRRARGDPRPAQRGAREGGRHARDPARPRPRRGAPAGVSASGGVLVTPVKTGYGPKRDDVRRLPAAVAAALARRDPRCLDQDRPAQRADAVSGCDRRRRAGAGSQHAADGRFHGHVV